MAVWYRTGPFDDKITPVRVVRVSKRRVTIQAGMQEMQYAKQSSWHTFHESKKDAARWLINLHLARIQEARRAIETANRVIDACNERIESIRSKIKDPSLEEMRPSPEA